MSEYANKKMCGAFIAAVFALQGFGILTSGIVALVVSASFDHAFAAPTCTECGCLDRATGRLYLAHNSHVLSGDTCSCGLLLAYEAAKDSTLHCLVAKNDKQVAQDMARVLNVELEAKEEKLEKFTEKHSNTLPRRSVFKRVPQTPWASLVGNYFHFASARHSVLQQQSLPKRQYSAV